LSKLRKDAAGHQDDFDAGLANFFESREHIEPGMVFLGQCPIVIDGDRVIALRHSRASLLSTATAAIRSYPSAPSASLVPRSMSPRAC